MRKYTLTVLCVVLISLITCKRGLEEVKDWPPYTKNAILKSEGEKLILGEAEILAAIETKDTDKLLSFFSDEIVFGWHEHDIFPFKRESDSQKLKDRKSEFYSYLFDYEPLRAEDLRMGYDGRRSFLEALKDFDDLLCFDRQKPSRPNNHRELHFGKLIEDKFSSNGTRETANVIYLQCDLSDHCKIYMFNIN